MGLPVDLPALLSADPLRAALWVAGYAAALVVFFVAARSTLRTWIRRRRLTLARERGADGEVRAAAMLERLGFTILGRQVGGGYGLGVDGERLEIDLRADYVVEARRGRHRGRRFVAEVKTGAFAPRLDTATTRRQLLEYRIAFDVDGVLLVDAEAGRVHLVEFPLPEGQARAGGRAAWLLAGMAAGVATGALAALAFVARAR